jgi:hypothetical protein
LQIRRTEYLNIIQKKSGLKWQVSVVAHSIRIPPALISYWLYSSVSPGV